MSWGTRKRARRITKKHACRHLQYESLENRLTLTATTLADVVFLVDRSGTGTSAEIPSWLANHIAQFDSTLRSNNIDVRYGLVSYAETPAIDAHSILVDQNTGKSAFDRLWSDGTNQDQLLDIQTAFGNLPGDTYGEDGWNAIEHALSEYNFRHGSVPIFVLIQYGEGREVDNVALTHDGILSALKSNNVVLDVMTIGDSSDLFDLTHYAQSANDFDNLRILGVEASQDGTGMNDYYAFNTALEALATALPVTKSDALQVSFNGSNTGATGLVGSQKSILFDTTGAGLGPSLQGYRARGVPFTSVDMSGANEVAIDGNSDNKKLTSSAQSGFTFNFMGENESSNQIWVYENGGIKLTHDTPTPISGGNLDLSWGDPARLSGRLIAPLWDQFQVNSTHVFYKFADFDGDSTKDVAIQWNAVYDGDVGDSAGRDPISFQLVLYGNNKIQINYIDLDSYPAAGQDSNEGTYSHTGGISATVGLWYNVSPDKDGVTNIPAGKFVPGLHSIFAAEDVGVDGGTPHGDGNDSYVRLAWDTGGSVWDSQFLSASGKLETAFASKFIDSVKNQITRNATAKKVFQNDNVVVAYNLGGAILSSEGFDEPDTFTGTSYSNATANIYTVSNSIPQKPAPTAPYLGNKYVDVFRSAKKSTSETGDLNLSITRSMLPALKDGHYVVELFFCESFGTSAGEPTTRQFDVQIEGKTVLNNYSIAGDVARIEIDPDHSDRLKTVAAGELTGIVKRFDVMVGDTARAGDDAGLQITLKHEASYALLNGIRILSGLDPHPDGDYNRDGEVNAADYNVYRNYLGQNVIPWSGADGNGDAQVTVTDFNIWRGNFGATNSSPGGGALAYVPGDYTHDGIVDIADRNYWQANLGTDNPNADGNFNGIVDMADLEVWQEMLNVTTLNTLVGDFNGDFVVDTQDEALWAAGSPLADADSDGIVLGDMDDFNTWNVHFGTVRADVFPEVLHATEGRPLEVPCAAPKVVAVAVGSFGFSGTVGSGEQLRSVSVSSPNAISIRFSEEVFVTQNALQVINLDGTSPNSVTSFTYSVPTQTATWTFNAALNDGRTLLRLGDSVIDLDHDALDGEFTNPWTLAQTGTSVLPSGNGTAGGEFRFRFTVLAADSDHDNIAGATNYQNWKSYEPGRAYVSTTTDDCDSDVSYGDFSLREAINYANTATEPTTIELPAGHYYLTRSGTETANTTTYNDLDILGNVKIVGAGPGATIIDAGNLTADDRVFDVVNSGVLGVSHATIALGAAPTTSGQRDGGAVRVQNGGQFDLDYSAIVGNATTRSGYGGAIFFAATAHGSITDSVITVNYADNMTGGVYLSSASAGTGGAVTVSRSIIVNNTASDSYCADVYAGTNRTFTSGGYNRLGNAATGFTNGVNGDYIKPAGTTVAYVVTSVVDSYDGSADLVDLSLRDAIYLANTTAGTQEIWLPAWDFVLTRQRTTAANLPELNISEGDIEITDSLILRGIGGTTSPATSVAWMDGAVADRVFELIGDYNGDGAVDTADYVMWADEENQTGSNLPADGDDDGVVESDDYNQWAQNYGDTLQLFDIAV